MRFILGDDSRQVMLLQKKVHVFALPCALPKVRTCSGPKL